MTPDSQTFRQSAPKVYLAGPGVFRPDATEIGERLKECCAKHGLHGLWPADNDPIGDTIYSRAENIYHKNMRMIEEASAVVADLSPFRGPHMDCGTAFEIGVAIAAGTPVFAYTSDTGDLAYRMTRIADGTVLRDADGNLIEDFGFPENLMIAISVEQHWSDNAEDAIRICAQHLGTYPR